jgi:hypothetical protein
LEVNFNYGEKIPGYNGFAGISLTVESSKDANSEKIGHGRGA